VRVYFKLKVLILKYHLIPRRRWRIEKRSGEDEGLRYVSGLPKRQAGRQHHLAHS
jgi:hypothetical protein